MKFNKLLYILPLMLIISVSLVSAVGTAPDSSNGVAYWALKDLTDETGTYTLTNNGATSGATGIIDNAYSFDGSNNYMSFSSTNLFDGTKDFSISLWFNYDTLINNNRVIDLDGDNSVGIWYDNTNAVLRGGMYISEWKFSDIPLSDLSSNTWFHLVYTYNTVSGSEIFLNSVSKDSNTGTGSVRSGLGSINTIGRLSSSSLYFWDGKIDEISFFDVTLSQDEINYLYASGSPNSAQQYPFISAEVLTTNITGIYLDPNGTVYGDETGLKGIVVLNQTSGIYLNYTYYVNDVAVVNGQDTTPTSSNDLPLLSNTYFEHRDEVYVSSIAVNSSNSSQALSETRSSNVLTIANYAPTVTASYLPLTALNETDIEFFCTTVDSDSDLLNISWRIYNETNNLYTGTINDQDPSTHSVYNLSNTATNIGDNYTLECNVTDDYLTDTATSTKLTITDILNFTVTATNEWGGSAISNFNVSLLSSINSFNGTNPINFTDDGAAYYAYWDNSNFSARYLYTNNTKSVIPTNCYNQNPLIIKRTVRTGAFDIYSYSCYDNSDYENINNFSLLSSYDIEYYSFDNYNTSTGSIITPIISNNTASVTVFADDYFNHIYNDWNLSNNLAAILYQSVINFSAYELITGDELTGVTYTIDGETNTTFHLSVGTHTVTASKSGYYDLDYTFNVSALDNKTINITGMYDSILNITASVYSTGNSINTFNISTSHANVTTTNGYAELPTLQNYENTITIDAGSNYATRNNQLYTTTASVNTTNYVMYPYNSIRILIYNGTTDGLIDFQNTTIYTISDITSFTNTTTTGNITLSFLTPEDYELRFESEGYTDTSYFVTVTNDTTQEIIIYMTANDSNTDIQRVKVVDKNNNPVEGAIVWLQKENYGTYATVNQKVSSNDGSASFYVSKDIDKYYRFIVIYDGEVKLITEKTVFVPGIDDIIELEIDIDDIIPNDIFDEVLGLNYTLWFTGSNDSVVNYQFIDAANKISGGWLLITMEDLITGETITKYNTTKSGSSGLYTVPLDMLNDSIYTIKAYVTYSNKDPLLVSEATRTFNLTVIVDRNIGLLYAVIIFLFTALLTANNTSPLLSGVISLVVLIPLTMIKIISVPIGIITGFLVLFLIVFMKIRGGNNQ